MYILSTLQYVTHRKRVKKEAFLFIGTIWTIFVCIIYFIGESRVNGNGVTPPRTPPATPKRGSRSNSPKVIASGKFIHICDELRFENWNLLFLSNPFI